MKTFFKQSEDVFPPQRVFFKPNPEVIFCPNKEILSSNKIKKISRPNSPIQGETQVQRTMKAVNINKDSNKSPQTSHTIQEPR